MVGRRPHRNPRTLETLKANLGQVSTGGGSAAREHPAVVLAAAPDERSAAGPAGAARHRVVRWYENPKEPAWVLTEIFKQAPHGANPGPSPAERPAGAADRRGRRGGEGSRGLAQHRRRGGAARGRATVLPRGRVAAADVYAKAAENRGSWDARLESLVVRTASCGATARTTCRCPVSALG
ncbi:hypothetical protein QJS66_01240 [Kocuria rhizophila]|nr:hypothetical protein QJS66_01240 [Kocuria rhizophila]